MIRKSKLVAACLSASLVLVACGGSSSKDAKSTDKSTAASATPSKAAPTGTLTVGMAGFPATLAADEGQFGNNVLYVQAIYDTLLHAAPDDSLQPWLATEWKYSDDLKTLTLKLRTDVKFTDGTAFDAAAAVANLDRFKKGKAAAASYLASMASAKAVDASTLEITLSAPDPAFVNYLARDAGAMESPKSFGAANEKTAPVGSGPYVVNTAKTVAESMYVYDINPNYWAKDKGIQHYQTVILKPIQDPAAAVNAIKAGEIDAINVFAPDALADIKAAGWTLNQQQLDWVGLTLVDRDGKMGSPLKDVKVRQALSYAFDRKAILAGVVAGNGAVTTQVFPKSSAAYDESFDSKYPYDPAKAKALLAEAGFPNGFEIEMPSVVLVPEALYAVIKDSLRAVGVTVKQTDVAPPDFIASILTPKFPAYLMFLEQSPNEWQFINFLLSKTAVFNPAKYSDPKSDELIGKIQLAKDADRPTLIKQLGAYVFEQAWHVPFYRLNATFATNAKTEVKLQAGNVVPYLWNITPKG
jgi:peptide/nickel transport system substrate-binding protein